MTTRLVAALLLFLPAACHNESITVVVSTPHAPCSASDTIAGLVIDTARVTR